MNESQQVHAQRAAAEQFVASHLPELCRELVAFDESGLFGTGKAHQLRTMCTFAGSSAQALATGMVETAAVRAVAKQAAITRNELLRSMDAWGATGFVVDDRAVNFLNYFLGSRCAADGQPA